jgi:hypothetical protein
MQPYIFPYIGYFHLIEASDVFVFYDDVNFIKGGWINRNRILINGAPYKFCVPLSNGSPNQLIYNVTMRSLGAFRDKFLQQLQNVYRKAPHFKHGIDYVEEALQNDSDRIADLAIRSIVKFYDFVGASKTFLRSSQRFTDTKGIGRAERLIQITRLLGAKSYVNPMGGVELYDKEYFLERGVQLAFIKPTIKDYRQIGSHEFVEGLSIIDIVMHNDKSEILTHLNSFNVI